MAAGDSKTSIANLALAMVGEDPIANVDPPDNNKRGRLCAQFYDSSRRAVLEAAPWRCAKRQLQAAAVPAPPAFTYGAAYPVPADFIRMFELPEDDTIPWEIMNLAGIGPCLVTNAGPPLDTSYIFDLQDTTMMPPLLVKTIAADIALNIAYPLTRDRSVQDSCAAQREGYISLARTVSAQQASPRQFDADTLLRWRW